MGAEDKPEEKRLTEFEINVRHVEVVMQMHKGDTYEVKKTVMLWVDEAKTRYDAKR